MSITPLSKDQWVSVLRNAVFAGIAAVLAAVTAGSGDLRAMAVIAFMAALKVIEKALTPTN